VAPAAATVTVPAAKPAAGVAAQVKSWVNDKLSTVQSLWGTSPTAPRAKVAAPAVAVARPSLALPPTPAAKNIEDVGGRRTAQGVPVYDIKKSDSIPRLAVDREERVRASNYFVQGQDLKVLEERVLHPFETPDLLTEKQMKELASVPEFKPFEAQKMRDVEFQPKGRVSREGVDRIARLLKPEAELKLQSYNALSAEDMRFLSGLLLYRQGNKCAAAIGLFHGLAKKADWESEANYYLAMCSRELGLQTDYFERARRVLESQDGYYARKILKDLSSEIPNEFIEPVGAALAKVASNQKIYDGIDAKTNATVAYFVSL
jgi:hypothetical protein